MAHAGGYESVPVAPRGRSWTFAMGLSAARRATAWVGLPYSWAGGTTTGPTYGSCFSGDGGGGEFDCHVWGFDCSGLTMYGWGRYLSLPHFAASQYSVAGRFRPTLGELEPGDLLFFSGARSGAIGHVVMYIGRGNAVQAPESGHPVMISPVAQVLSTAGWYVGSVRPTSAGVQGPAPVVTGLSQHTVPTGGAVMITIAGSGFWSATSVLLDNAVGYTFRLVSPTRIQIRVPAHAPGVVNVRVAGPWGTSGGTAGRLSYVSH